MAVLVLRFLFLSVIFAVFWQDVSTEERKRSLSVYSLNSEFQDHKEKFDYFSASVIRTLQELQKEVIETKHFALTASTEGRPRGKFIMAYDMRELDLFDREPIDIYNLAGK